MSLKQDLQLKRPFQNPAHEAFLSIVLSGSLLKKSVGRFLRTHHLTDVQFNLLLLLLYQGDEAGLTQTELSHMMLVHRANITTLVDRMVRGKLVRREELKTDKRINMIQLTKRGRSLIQKAESDYYEEVHRVMDGLERGEVRVLIETLEKVRARL